MPTRDASTQKKKQLSQKRWRTERLSMRVHPDLKGALDFLASRDRRTLSQYVEHICIQHVRELLRNRFEDDGALAHGEAQHFILRDSGRR